MVDEIIWEKDYTPEKTSTWSSDGRYEYVHKKYYMKCYFKRGGNKKETRHKYLCDESDETIDHYDHSYTDTKEEKTGRYNEYHSSNYYFLRRYILDDVTFRQYEFKKYKRTITVLDNGKKIYGDWWLDDQYYK
jgi:hypothetical protein